MTTPATTTDIVRKHYDGPPEWHTIFDFDDCWVEWHTMPFTYWLNIADAFEFLKGENFGLVYFRSRISVYPHRFTS